MDTDSTRNHAKESAELKKNWGKRRRRRRRRKANGKDDLQSVDQTNIVSTLSMSGNDDVRNEVQSTTMQSPLDDHVNMDTDSTRNQAKESAERIKNRRKRRRRNRKANGKDELQSMDQTDIVSTLSLSGNDDERNEVQSTTLQSLLDDHVKLDTDSTINQAKESAERIKNRRKRRRRNRKANGKDDMQSVDQTDIMSTLNLSGNDDDRNEVQSTTLHSSLDDHVKMDTDSTRNHAKESAERKKNRRMRRKRNRKANGKDGTQSVDQTDIVSTLSLSGNDDKRNEVQSAAQEFGISPKEDSKSKYSKEKRPGFVNRVLGRKMKPFSHEGQHAFSTSICDPHLKQMAEKNVKFENELVQAAEVTKHASLSVVDKVDLLKDSHPSPERTVVACSRRKLVVLDVNGLLADIVSPPPKECKADINISRRAIFKRPFYYDFLKFCFQRFDVGIWTSRSKKIVDRVVDYLLGDMKHKLLFCWDLSHCTETGFKTLENWHKPLVCKELRKIWEKDDPNLPWVKGDYTESNTLLLDDSPYKALLNPMHTAIFPHSYNYKDKSDNSLGPGGDVWLYLEDLTTAENIQKFVEQHPFGQSAIDETSSFWAFYSGVLCSRSIALTNR